MHPTLKLHHNIPASKARNCQSKKGKVIPLQARYGPEGG